MAWSLRFALTWWWQRADGAVWLLPAWGTSTRLASRPVTAASPPRIRLRQDQGHEDIMLQGRSSLYQSVVLFGAGFFGVFFSKGKSSYITTKTFFLFNFYAAGILWSHCVGPWGAVPRMIPGRSRKTLLEIHLFSWLLPQNSPLGAVSGRQEDGWPEVFPHLCRRCFLKPVQSWWLSPVYKATAASAGAHSRAHSNSLCKEKLHSPSQERAQTQTSSSEKAAGTANTNSFSTSIIRGFHQHLESFVL